MGLRDDAPRRAISEQHISSIFFGQRQHDVYSSTRGGICSNSSYGHMIRDGCEKKSERVELWAISTLLLSIVAIRLWGEYGDKVRG